MGWDCGMKNLQLIAQNVPVEKLLNQILTQPELFKADDYHKTYKGYPFEDTETIYVRMTPNAKEFVPGNNQDCHEAVWMDGALKLPALRPIIFGLMGSLEGERLGRVLINKLAPGKTIFEHKDPEIFTSYWNRYHLCLQSAPGCICKIEDEQVYMRPGEVWWFNNGATHGVTNNSKEERIHVIIDIHTSRFNFKGQLPSDKKETPDMYIGSK